MRINSEDHPITFDFLKRFKLDQRDVAGRLKLPDLISFFDKKFKKNADNHQYLVSSSILRLMTHSCGSFSFKVVPLFLKMVGAYFPNSSVRTSINEYVYSFGVKPWKYDSTKVVLK